MDTLITFAAQYVWILSPILAGWYLLKLPGEKRREFLAFAATLLPLAFVLGLVAKALWLNPTPVNPSENGFPSDHTLLVASLAVLVTFSQRSFSLWLWLIAVAVAVSRVLVGEHHMIDVIGSIGIALLSGIAARAIMQKLWKQQDQSPRANS